MQIRIPTQASLAYDRAAGAVSLIALSAALLSPPALAWPLAVIPVIVFAVLTPMSIARQRKGDANLALVSPRERRAYLIMDTALVLGMLACLGVVFFLILTSASLSMRAGFGLAALGFAAVASYLRGKATMEHAARILPVS